MPESKTTPSWPQEYSDFHLRAITPWGLENPLGSHANCTNLEGERNESRAQLQFSTALRRVYAKQLNSRSGVRRARLNNFYVSSSAAAAIARLAFPEWHGSHSQFPFQRSFITRLSARAARPRQLYIYTTARARIRRKKKWAKRIDARKALAQTSGFVQTLRSRRCLVSAARIVAPGAFSRSLYSSEGDYAPCTNLRNF